MPADVEAAPDPRREAWIADRRAAVARAYDAEAGTYDSNPYPNEHQQEWVRRLLTLCRDHGLVLDAPCGTGRYFPLVAAAERRVVGVDQSSKMLAEAERRGIATELLHVGLQELPYVDRFDAAMTIDAMENVAPEDWPVVVANVRRALRAGGHWYMTVEEDHSADFDAEHAALVARGLAAVRGEIIDGDVAGYHYYPTRDQVMAWLADAEWTVVDEAYHHEEAGWGYRHLLLRR
jgi:cyclopropane fatty-acyl-phospholipid synthase-like methyltransferase